MPGDSEEALNGLEAKEASYFVFISSACNRLIRLLVPSQQSSQQRLSTILTYAKLKMDNGWTHLRFDEVESLYLRRFQRSRRGSDEVVHAVKRIAREEQEFGAVAAEATTGNGNRVGDESGGRSAVSLGKRKASQQGDGGWDDEGRAVDPHRTVVNRSNVKVSISTTLPSPAPSTRPHRYDHDISRYSNVASPRTRSVNSAQPLPKSTRTQSSFKTSSTPSKASSHTTQLISPPNSTLPTSYESFWAAMSTSAGMSHAAQSVSNGNESESRSIGTGTLNNIEVRRNPVRRPPMSNGLGTTSMLRSRTEPIPMLNTISPPPSTPPPEGTESNENGSHGNLVATEFPSPSTSQPPFLTYTSLSPSTVARQSSLSPQSNRGPFSNSTVEHRYNGMEDTQRLSQASRRSAGGVLSRMTGSQLLSDPLQYLSEDKLGLNGTGVTSEASQETVGAGSTQ